MSRCSSSNRISNGIGSPTISSGVGCGMSHSIASPGLILSEGLAGLPLTVTTPCSIRRWAAARERPAVWVLRKMSRRLGASPAETVTRRAMLNDEVGPLNDELSEDNVELGTLNDEF